jgi:hypothetical protein
VSKLVQDFLDTPLRRWQSSIQCEPYYSKYHANIFRKLRPFGVEGYASVLIRDIYQFELDRKYAVAEMLDKIMGGC